MKDIRDVVSTRCTQVCILLVFLTGLMALVGWFNGAIFLTRLSENEVPMAPSTAFVFIGLTVGLWFALRPKEQIINRIVVFVSSGFVIGLSSLIAITNICKHYSSWEHLFIQVPESELSMPLGHMSLVTAILFILSGFSLLFLQRNGQRMRAMSLVLSLLVFIISFILTLGYGFGVPFFYLDHFIPPAALTGLSFLWISLGLIASTDKNSFLGKIVWETSTRSKMLRIFVPTIIGITIIDHLIVIRLLPLLNIQPAIGILLVSLATVIVVIVAMSIISKSLGDSLDLALEKLNKSETVIKSKLQAITESDGDMGSLELAEIIDTDALQSLMDNVYELTGMTGGILDLSGNILVSVGWQDICTKFHRTNPDSCKNCLKSDTYLTQGVPEGTFKAYKCENNMWDMVTPIMVGGRHLGNIFMGQYLLADEEPNYDVFRKQAKQYGFDEKEYLEALDRVPRFSQEKVNLGMEFYSKLAGMISTLSFSLIQQSRMIEEQKQAEVALQASEEIFRTISENAPVLISSFDASGRCYFWNEACHQTFGWTLEELNEYEDALKLFYPDSVVCDEMKQAIASDPSGHFREWNPIAKSGKEISMMWANFKLPDGKVFSIGQDITERVHSEELLLTNKKRLESALNSIGAGAVEVDVKTGECWRTFQHDKILGYSELLEKWTVDMLFAHVVPEDKERIINHYYQSSVSRDPWESEFRINRKDGAIRWISIHGYNEANKAGEIERMFGIVQDITETKLAEEKLKDREQKYKALYENAPLAYQSLNPDGTFKDVNPRWLETLGYERNEVIGAHYVDFLHPDWKEQFETNFLAFKKRGHVSDVHFKIRHKLGHYIDISFEGCIGYNSDGSVRQTYCVFQEITERLLAEEKVAAAVEENERNAKYYENIINNMGDPIFVKDDQSRFVLVNDVFCELFDLPRDKIIGSTLAEDVSPEEQQEFLRIDQQVLLDGKDNINEETLTIRDGLTRTISTKKTRFIDHNGDAFLVGVIRDITEQSKLEEKVHQSEKMQVVGQLAGGMAHDFNNQLSGILGFSEILIGTLKDEKQIRQATMIKKCALQSASLTAKLLAFGHKGKALSTPVSMHKVIRDVVEILEHTIDKKVTIQQVLHADSEITLGDPSQLQNAVLNIAINARDAMPDGGELTFETEVVKLDHEFCRYHPEGISAGNYIVISIADKGCGMDAETQKHIFEPFYTTKGIGKGTGMGLASVYGTIQNHKGIIDVSSAVAKGTTFKIYLPLFEEMETEEQPDDRNELVSGTARIILVDDEEGIREFASDILGKLGYQVTSFSNGKEAVEYYETAWREVDLVILDMMMPVMGGREAFSLMKKINPNILSILASGYGINEEAQAMLDEGVKAFIRKPYVLFELSDTVSQVLQKKDPK